MSSHRISKWALASPGGTAIVVGRVTLTSDSSYLLREGSGRVQVIGYYVSGLSNRAISASVVHRPRMLRLAEGCEEVGEGAEEVFSSEDISSNSSFMLHSRMSSEALEVLTSSSFSRSCHLSICFDTESLTCYGHSYNGP
ncbi:hypothetical protein AVEN_38673-1 [Araneus ventricosus]|uniref:Uncharacterized protein n=1 Tax=Araneus ventricosus TaxID=182803 RepID=A0A4Y2LZT6_ARAVE|nr:hypothetical protein AVEN_38673-1 [Araneus ventricosus]